MIYPLFEKQIYNDPFSYMFFQLKRTLKSTDYWFIIGYSLRDKEMRDIFNDSIFSRIKQEKKTKIFTIDPHAEKIISKEFGSFGNSDFVQFININETIENSISEIKEKFHTIF